MDKISVVIPCYNEEDVISETISRVCEALSTLSPLQVELVIVDDGSADATVEKARRAELRPGVSMKIVRFSRNFGHQMAVSAGIQSSSGDAIAIIDADLQDPPELIPEMLRKLQDGNDVVYGRRILRRGTALWKRASYSLFYWLIEHLVAEIEIPRHVGDFRVISRRMADYLVAMPENGRFIRGMIPFLGFSQVPLDYERDARRAGMPKYTLPKLIQLALDGIVNFSTQPLRIALYLGMLMFALSAAGIISVFAIRLGTEEWVPGWAGTLIVILSFGGIQFLFLGLLGEYVGRIFQEVKKRPPFIVAEEIIR